jgi:hypothetical protein
MVPNLLAVSNLYSFFHQLLIRLSRIQKFNLAVIQSQMAKNYVTAATATISYQTGMYKSPAYLDGN